MNILMLTNTFTPHVGGVARSVEGFATEFRNMGHRVLIAAPLFEGTPKNEADVIRFPAIHNFSRSEFSVPMPIPGKLAQVLRTFHPSIVHSHHPFLLGNTALRVAAARNIPALLTYHTMYEQYTHYFPGDSPRLKHFVVDLVTGYCNLCDAVIAPSESVARLLVRRGVKVPIEVIPTGVDAKAFATGDGSAFRARIQIASDAFVVGHTGRLAPEKNLGFLADAVVRFLHSNDRAHFLVVGDCQSKEGIQCKCAQYGLGSRIHLAGILNQKELAGAYRAMDVFAFASQTETQGMVLTEAMAAGVPVVAVDASGVREVVRDRVNGRLLPQEDLEEFASALRWIASLNPQMKKRLKAGIAETISEFAMPCTAKRVLTLYQDLIKTGPAKKESQESHWASSRRLLEEELKILRNIVHAAGDAVLPLSKAPGG